MCHDLAFEHNINEYALCLKNIIVHLYDISICNIITIPTYPSSRKHFQLNILKIVNRLCQL